MRGYKEEGTTTTPFDMVVRNDMDRFHLVMDVIDRVPGLARRAAGLRQHMVDKRTEHRDYIRRTGEDLPEVRDWTWPTGRPTPARATMPSEADDERRRLTPTPSPRLGRGGPDGRLRTVHPQHPAVALAGRRRDAGAAAPSGPRSSPSPTRTAGC